MNFDFHTPVWITAFVSVAVFIVNFAFVVGVYADIQKLRRDGKRIYLVNPFFWVLAVAVGGVIAAGIYWFIHHLNLERNSDTET